MKRLFTILSLVMLSVACGSESRNPAITGYRLRQVGSVDFGADGVTAGLTLELDVKNPSASRYTLESLEAILYRGNETSPFAEVTMPEPATIEPRCEETVPLPLQARFTRPLALLSGGFDTDLSIYTADVDLTVRKGSFKKRITKERVPLDQLGHLLGQNTKTNENEKE